LDDHGPNGRFSGFKYEPVTFREDGVLTKLEVAKLNSEQQNTANSPENRTKPLSPTMTQELDRMSAVVSKLIPQLDVNFVNNLPGGWAVTDRSSLVKSLVSRASRTFTDKPSPQEVAQTKYTVLRSLKRFIGSGTKGVYVELVSDRGDSLRVYSSPRGSSPIATNEDIRLSVDSIQKVRSSINIYKPMTVSIVGPSSLLPDGSAGTDSSTWGFSYPGGGAHIIPARIKKGKNIQSEDYSPQDSWHSVPSNDYGVRSTHTVYHELGHTIMYQNWGTDKTDDARLGRDDGSSALRKDYQKFGITGQAISKYGSKSTAEHFAEAFARYIQIGDATPEFLALLESKNLLKSQVESPEDQLSRMSVNTPKDSSLNPDTNVLDLDFPIAIDASEGPPDTKTAVKSSKDAKERVLASITETLAKGEIPWRKPFSDGLNFAGEWVPRNPSSKRIYTGINSLVLQHEQSRNDYKDPRWMTYKQAQEMGGQVRKGETGVAILVPIPKVKKEKDPTTGNEKITGSYVSFIARSVFNVAQIDGLNLPTAKEEAGEPKTPLESQDFIIERYKKSMEAKGLKAPVVRYTYVGEYGNHASSPNWNPLFDEITLPTREQFNSPEEMFNTITHELAHSTGHSKRLNRDELLNNYGKDVSARGREELIAEISSAILASMFGVNSVYDNQAAYVQSWMKAIKDDPNILGISASEAQKVVDYLLGMDLGDWSPVDGYSVGSKSSKDEE